MRPLVSIVTPLYNSENLIEETIESVIQQDYTNWEMIIVDDCSTDNSATVVDNWVKKDNRITLHRLDSNSGAAVARNTGISLASGNYLCFLDSDDTWLAEKLSKQVTFMLAQDVAFSFTEYAMFDEKGQIFKERVASPKKINFRGLLSGRPIMCSSVMLDLDKTGPVQMPNIRSGQDYATWGLLLRDRIKYAYNVGQVLALYRKQKGSLSANKIKALKRTWLINRKILQVNTFSSVSLIFVYAWRWLAKHFFP